MIITAIGYLLLLLGLAAVALQRLYSFVPVRELKRLARRHDPLAAALYRVAAYGASLRLLLWIIATLGIAGGLVLTVPPLIPIARFSLLIVVALLALILLPSLRLTQRSAPVAAICSRVLIAVLRHTHGALEKMASLANRFRDMPRHSRLYEKEDLAELIGRQKDQADNRIHLDDLELVQRALGFSDLRAADVVQPRKEAHLVNADDSIGPILLDQLHKQGQSSFLVYKDGTDNIIGSLAMSDAVTAKQGGRVFDLIRSDLIYVHEDFSARQVLQAFHKTGHQVAVVINNAEEFVGVITLNRLLQNLLGGAQDDEMSYGNRQSIAGYKPPAKKQQSEASADSEQSSTNISSSSETTEVVE